MVDRSSLTREWTMDAIILAPGAALELIQFYRRRIDELLDTTNRYLERARDQSALATEREAIAAEARRYAGNYPEASDGRNTFIIFAEWVEGRILPAQEPTVADVPAVSAIVPPHCSGSAFVFDPGVLHVNKDGSGYIVVDEDDFVLEDDRCEGEHGPEGSVHWIVRLDASEVTALRDFLNGSSERAPDLRELSDTYEDILRCVCGHLELPQSESGPADDITLYDVALHNSDLLYRTTEAERVEHKNARYKAEAEIERLRKNLFPILHLIRQFAEDTNERNWAEKRLYIKQQAERAIGEIALERKP